MSEERLDSTIRFVGLHAHSVAGSPFDGLGYPAEHMDFAYQNGMDALALTDHGNCNGLAYQVLHAKQMQSEGKEFKPIYGVEAYFLPSIDQWKEDYEAAKLGKKAAKKTKKDATSSGTVLEDENRTLKSKVNRRRHLILLAQNQTGLSNIFKLVSASYLEGNFYRFPRVDYALLEKYNEGILAASACLGGVYAGDMWEHQAEGPEAVLEAMRETTKKMLAIFGDRWYGELQWNSIPEQHALNKYIIQICTEFDIKMISTADSHYPSPPKWKDRILYKKLGWLSNYAADQKLVLPESVDEVGYELYPKNGDQMWDSYKKYSALTGEEYDDDLVLRSIQETWEISQSRIEAFLPDNTVKLPSFVVPSGETPESALTALSVAGLKQLLRSRSDVDDESARAYATRLKEELDIINERGFSKYFLTMKAIADKAVETQLTGSGRGSAAGSLVSYALGITQVDPIKYGLLFSRFLRKDAKDYPDIDYDVSDPMALKDFLAEEWGENTVIPISNWNTLQLRSLIKDISKLYQIPFTEVNAVTGRMLFEATPAAKAKHGIKAGVYTPTFEEVMEYSATLKSFLLKYPHVKTHIEALCGQVRSCSRHAGGVVIGENLDEQMPLIVSGGVRQTPWSEGQHVRHLEPLGFIKFDILGLSTLRMIEGAVRHILKRHHGVEDPTFKEVRAFYDKHLHPDVMDLKDPAVYSEIFHRGSWAGVFQFTETGAQSFCRNVKPNSIIEIAAVTSIFRPGPLSAGVDKKFISAKSNPASIKYVHEIVREVTEETYGFLIFQEQIAMLAHRLGKDISLDEGNILRKLLTKKGTGETNKAKTVIYNKFIAGCIEKNISHSDANYIWSTFEFFSGYGFNKSHAVSYSLLSYQCAWLLHYYPSEWSAAFLDKEPERRKEKAINLVKRLGFNVQSLDINTSGVVWEIAPDNTTLVQPLTSVKGLGDAAINQIMTNRPFASIEEFLFNEDITYSKLNKKAIDVLIRSQALNNLMDERFSGLKHFWSAVAVDRPKNRKKFYENIELYHPEGDFSTEEKIEYLVSLTGAFPMGLVMSEKVQGELEHYGIPPLGEFDEDLGAAWFIPREVIEKKTKNGKLYWILRVIDSTSTTTSIKCWGVKPDLDVVHLNHPYMAKLDYDSQWGFSTRSLRRNFKLLA